MKDTELTEVCEYLLQQADAWNQKDEAFEKWRADIHRLLTGMQDMIVNQQNAISSLQKDLVSLYKITRLQRENLEYEWKDPRKGEQKYWYPNIVSGDVAIREIVEKGKSLARFGDGEISIIAGIERAKFQKVDEKLADRLKEVLHSRQEDLLIGIADNYGSLDRYCYGAAQGIRSYMTPETRKLHEQLLETDRIYYDAYVTRPYILYEDRFTDAPAKRFKKLQSIWEKRNIIMVEGAKTRFGVKNDFLSNVESVRRILGPAENSFDRYGEILEAVLKNAKEKDLVLIAMGPCAGVLAYDLCKKGIQAVDIGHADLEYEWFLAGQGERVAVPYKYNNEFLGGELVADIQDADYEAQIIEIFA
ncbi:MAG: DUF1792 domain-containing protein [Clostridiales bacterium]|nr:DUF1792 domain-containing protein [Clostridiales bacterium]